jgi:hypothetical protein
MNSLQDNLWTKNVALCEKNRENQKPLNTLFYCLYFTNGHVWSIIFFVSQFELYIDFSNLNEQNANKNHLMYHRNGSVSSAFLENYVIERLPCSRLLFAFPHVSEIRSTGLCIMSNHYAMAINIFTYVVYNNRYISWKPVCMVF